MAMNCLTGCIGGYTCGATQFVGKPIDAHSLSPFVKIWFGDESNPDITVGNQSAPQWDNTAVIKSMQIGMSEGAGAVIEILDEQGGSFHLFAEKMAKCIGPKPKDLMTIQWGWIVTNCDGSYDLIPSPKVKVHMVEIAMTFGEGKIKFKLTAKDKVTFAKAARHDETEGSDKNRISLKTAIKNLAQNKEPKFDVKFVRLENGIVSSEEFGWKDGGKDGPTDIWDADGQDKLAVIAKWIEPFPTDRGKGVNAVFDPVENVLLLIEDTQPLCDEQPKCKSIGLYIVNGGACSSVISFSPQLDYLTALSNLVRAGNAGGAATGGTISGKRKCPVQTPETGILQSVPVSSYSWNVHGPKNSIKETRAGQEATLRAHVKVKSAIKAEMVIQGDPRQEFARPHLTKGMWLSIVVINPFHIFGNDNNNCGDWLAQPGCNDILSNRMWRIEGMSHNIKEGSYTTTLKLFLASPGIDIDAGLSFGGAGSNGYTPTNTC